jgi:hypothetical protein
MITFFARHILEISISFYYGANIDRYDDHFNKMYISALFAVDFGDPYRRLASHWEIGICLVFTRNTYERLSSLSAMYMYVICLLFYKAFLYRSLTYYFMRYSHAYRKLICHYDCMLYFYIRRFLPQLWEGEISTSLPSYIDKLLYKSMKMPAMQLLCVYVKQVSGCLFIYLTSQECVMHRPQQILADQLHYFLLYIHFHALMCF